MSALKESDGPKWINTSIVLTSILVGFLFSVFLSQCNDWFDLEAKVQNFKMVSNLLTLVIGITFFAIVYRNQKAKLFLSQVYSELVKVVWPDKDSVIRLTIGIVIFVAIASGIFVMVDLGIRKILALLY